MVARGALFTILLAGSVAAAACDRADRATPVANSASGDRTEAQVLFGVRHIMTVRGVRRAELRADTALFNDSMTRAELRGVHLTVYSPAGDSVVGALTAPAATYDLRARRISARGGVTLLVDGRRTTTSEASYDGATGSLTRR